MRSLDAWLDYQQRLHPHAIALGLGRVREVWRRLGAPAPAPTVITVGGTNGKGSTVAFLEAIATAAGLRVGAYTSPHLLRYNERARIAGRDLPDAGWIDAFERIEAARGDIALTYFEFGTLAALWQFAQAAIDLAVLEVGLGGRLDAVNLIDADAAIVTTVDLDHEEWLGRDRDSIGREKAGIFRAGRPAIVGDAAAPAAVPEHARAIGAQLVLAGRDYDWQVLEPGRWRWRSGDTLLDLPMPALAAPVQLANAAAAIAALHALRARWRWDAASVASGIAAARASARLQCLAHAPDLYVDVAHNPQAAHALAQWLAANPSSGRTLAVYGALGDKDVAGVVAALAGQVDRWYPAALDALSPRGLDAAALAQRLAALPRERVAAVSADVAGALALARAQAGTQDRIIAFGSFFVAAAVLAAAPPA